MEFEAGYLAWCILPLLCLGMFLLPLLSMRLYPVGFWIFFKAFLNNEMILNFFFVYMVKLIA